MEEIHYLIPEKLQIIQNNSYFKFGNDSVLLANFVSIRPGERVLDLGSGSGVIPLLVGFKQNPDYILGLEIQKELVELSRHSLRLNNMDEFIDIIHGDLKNIKKHVEAGHFDTVISNPPYLKLGQGKITSNQKQAVARHEIKADLEDVINAASWSLKNGGYFYIIHLADRMAEVMELTRKNNLEPKQLRLIQSTPENNPDRFLLKTLKNGNPGLSIDSALVEYKSEGREYTEEMKHIYGEDYNGSSR